MTKHWNAMNLNAMKSATKFYDAALFGRNLPVCGLTRWYRERKD